MFFVHSEALKNAVFCGTLEVLILLRQTETSSKHGSFIITMSGLNTMCRFTHTSPMDHKKWRILCQICPNNWRFCRLSMGIQTFARFVPEAVVRNIIKGGWAMSDVVVGGRICDVMAKNMFF